MVFQELHISQQESQPDYVTSVGGVGLQHRTYGRESYTPSIPFTEGEDAAWYLDITKRRLVNPEFGRAMVRGLMTESALTGFWDTYPERRDSIEVAVPLHSESEEDRLWFVVLGENGSKRQTQHSQEQIIAFKEGSYREPISARSLVESVLDEGGRFATNLEENHVREQVFALWQERFDWTEKEVKGLTQRLKEETQLPDEKRSLWFSSVVDTEGTVKAVAMAEALDFSLGNGKVVRFVESTEWASAANGYIKAAVAHVGSQVFHDNPGENVVLFAECNMINAAPTVAHTTGYSIPDVQIGEHVIPQVHRQNVHVGDGENQSPYRDFFWMHVSPQARRDLYASEDIAEIIRVTRQ